MPVSVVCESTANAVNAALRDSLGVGSCAGNSQQQQQLHNGGIGANRAMGAVANLGSGNVDDNDDDTMDSLQNRLVANAKRVLLSKIEYEEVDNYNQTVLDNLKSKYIIIKPNEYQHQIGANISAVATCRNNTNGHDSSAGDTTNGNARSNSKSPAPNGKQQQQQQQHQQIKTLQPNPNELPTPKRILFARENVRIGWKGTCGPAGRKWNVGVGMMNVGNTCYLNSTLQALFHVPALANWLLSDSAHMERCDTADAGCIICAMAKTLQASQNNQSSIRPFLVYSKLKAICKHMVMGRQEDAHEFLRFLVEAMEKSYLSRFRNHKEFDQYSKETTPLNQILGGYLKSAVRCLSCSHVSVTFQHFQDLLLDIRKADSIEEALEGYFSRERLEDTGYKCEACKKKVSATKQFSLERAPIALCIQLKRFSIVGTKLNKQITIKPRLDLTKFASRKTPGDYPLTYKLVAMVTHLGVSQHCGHYTAIGLTESGTYYNYDDSYVRPISVQSVCNTNAYIIFYEMDNAASLRTHSPASSTQVSGAVSPKLNGVRVTNGHVSPSPQRIIGPQLPPGGLASYTKSASPALITTPNGKQNTQRHVQNQMTPNGSNKITIHFKNGHASLVKSNGVNSSVATTTTNSTTATNQQQQQNGLLMGTGKFQESTHAKSSLVCATNKGQTFTNANSNKSSSNNASSYTSDDDDDDDVGDVNKVSSSTTATTSTQCQRKLNNTNANSMPTLPSMPGLFNGASNGKKTNHNGVIQATKQQFKSLVPYESATDDEEPTTITSATTSSSIISVTASTETNAKRLDNPLKRPSSASSSSLSSDDDDDETDKSKLSKSSKTAPHTTNGKMSKKSMKSLRVNNMASSATPTQSSKVNNHNINNNNSNNHKQKTDAIDEIFNAHKRNGNNSPTKKPKPNKLQVSSTTPNSDSSGHDDESNDDSSNDGEDNKNNNGLVVSQKNGVSSAARTTLRPIKRSKSTPPSPPVIKTKVGIWQVTQNDEDEDEDVNKTKTLPAKNLKNPFSHKSPPAELTNNAKRSKTNGTAKQDAAKRNGNGYQLDSQTDGAVNELLKQSHRGYGASVLTWNGTQTEIEKEVIAEAREQRQRDWEHEEENGEHDRGRQRKTSKTAAAKQSVLDRTPGYNPFQEAENQKRWQKGGSSSGGGSGFYHHRFHNTTSGHFRHHFHQRSKFKFNRYGNGSASGAGSKFQQQRALQRHVANVGGANGRRNDAS